MNKNKIYTKEEIALIGRKKPELLDAAWEMAHTAQQGGYYKGVDFDNDEKALLEYLGNELNDPDGLIRLKEDILSLKNRYSEISVEKIIENNLVNSDDFELGVCDWQLCRVYLDLDLTNDDKKEIIEFCDFDLIENKEGFKLKDLQEVNLADIESQEFDTLDEILDRIEVYLYDFGIVIVGESMLKELKSTEEEIINSRECRIINARKKLEEIIETFGHEVFVNALIMLETGSRLKDNEEYMEFINSDYNLLELQRFIDRR